MGSPPRWLVVISLASAVAASLLPLSTQGAPVDDATTSVAATAPAAAARGVCFERGQAAHIVAGGRSALQKRIADRLQNYLSRVTGTSAQLVADLKEVPPGRPAIVLASEDVLPSTAATTSPSALEGFSLTSRQVDGRTAITASAHTDRGLKYAVQRLILAGHQSDEGFVIPQLRVTTAPLIPQREWTLCPWSPELVRGYFSNPAADRRINVWNYSDQQIRDYVDMFDSFGFSGCQLTDTVLGYAVVGSAEAYQDRLKKFAAAADANGQDVTLWV